MRKLYTTQYTTSGKVYDSNYVETHYCPSSDMTFITYETDNKIELIGFYFGEPNEYCTEHYIGSLIAELENN